MIISGTSVEQHLDFAARLQLVPRLLLLAHLNHSDYLRDAISRQTEQDLREHALEKASSRDVLMDPKGITLSQHLQSVYRQGVRAYRHRLSKAERSQRFLLSGIDRFRSAAINVRCRRCGKPSGRMCNGTSREADVALVNDNGECWRWFQEIFDTAVREANRNYSRFACAFSGAPDIEVVFRTTELPNGGASKAITMIEDERDRRRLRAIVEFKLPIKAFSGQTFFELPYKIFHEVIVHSVQGARFFEGGDVQRRPRYGSACPFAEGMVDAAAYDLLDRLLAANRNKRSKLYLFKKRLAKAILAQKQLRELGVMEEHSSVGILEARTFGYEVYSTLKDSEGQEKVFRLVLGLNIERLTPTDRLDIMDAFNVLIEGGGVVAGRDGLLEVALDCVEEYLDTGDWRAMVDHLKEI